MSDTDEISFEEAKLLEAYGPLEMARLIEHLAGELAWLKAFASVRAMDDDKTLKTVARGAMRTIADRADAAIEHTFKRVRFA